MQFEPDDMAVNALARQFDSCLSAFIIYEDVAAGKRAKETCDIVAQRLGDDWQIEIEMSSFRSLHVPQGRRSAALAAANANLVVYSYRTRDLPFEVRKWTESCLKRPGRPMALLALLDAPICHTGPPPVNEYLAGLAHRRGMQFFSHCLSPVAEAANGRFRLVT